MGIIGAVTTPWLVLPLQLLLLLKRQANKKTNDLRGKLFEKSFPRAPFKNFNKKRTHHLGEIHCDVSAFL